MLTVANDGVRERTVPEMAPDLVESTCTTRDIRDTINSCMMKPLVLMTTLMLNLVDSIDDSPFAHATGMQTRYATNIIHSFVNPYC